MVSILALNFSNNLAVWGVAYIGATVYAYSWDFHMDWGLEIKNFPRRQQRVIDTGDVLMSDEGHKGSVTPSLLGRAQPAAGAQGHDSSDADQALDDGTGSFVTARDRQGSVSRDVGLQAVGAKWPLSPVTGLQWQQRLTVSTLLPNWTYLFFTVLNAIGRTTWASVTILPDDLVLSVLTSSLSDHELSERVRHDLKWHLLLLLLAGVELYRRAQWCVLRVEWEHLSQNKKSAHRNFCWVPLLKPPLPGHDHLD